MNNWINIAKFLHAFTEDFHSSRQFEHPVKSSTVLFVGLMQYEIFLLASIQDGIKTRGVLGTILSGYP